MRESQTHEQLISLQRLCLDSRRIDFEQAFVTLANHAGQPGWNCTLRGIPADSLGTLQGDLSLRALSLDGRTIEGRVSGSSSLPPGADRRQPWSSKAWGHCSSRAVSSGAAEASSTPNCIFESACISPHHHGGSEMSEIGDDYMRQMIAAMKPYCVVILHATPKRQQPGVEQIIWEHGRRNFSLRADGVLSIVCPVTDDSDVAGIGIFNATIDEVRTIMDEDPGVKAGLFTYEVHPSRSFPGDCLPG